MLVSQTLMWIIFLSITVTTTPSTVIRLLFDDFLYSQSMMMIAVVV